MNQAAKDALRQAWLDGVPQLVGALYNGRGGYCALGLVQSTGQPYKAWVGSPWYTRISRCSACRRVCVCEGVLMVHYNNDHGFDFGKIAELMPDDPLDAAPAGGVEWAVVGEGTRSFLGPGVSKRSAPPFPPRPFLEGARRDRSEVTRPPRSHYAPASR